MLIDNSLIAQQDTIKIPSVQILGRKLTKQAVKNFISGSYYLQQRDIRFSVRSYGGVMSTLSIRGFKSSHTKLMVFGLPLQLGGMDGYDFFLVPMELFDSVGLHTTGQGIESVSGAMGGLISMDEAARKDDRLYYTLGIGSQGESVLATGIKRTQGKGYIAIKAGNHVSMNRYKYWDPYAGLVQTERRAAFSKNHLLLSMSYCPWSGSEVYYKQLTSDVVRAFPPPLTYVGPGRVETEHFRQNISTVGLRQEIQNSMLDMQLGFVSQSSDYHTRALDSLWIDMITSRWQSQSLVLGSELKHRLFSMRAFFLMQQYQFTSLLPQRVELTPRRSDLALAVTSRELRLWKIFFSTTQKIEIIDSAVYYLFDYQAEIKGGADVVLEFLHNVNYPSLNDLYWIPGGNAQLLPEEGTELNLHGSFDKNIGDVHIELSVEAFVANVRNWILWKPSSYHYWTAQNLPFVQNKTGIIELSFSANKGIFHNFRLSYEYSSVRDSAGRQIIYVPGHRVKANLGLRAAGFDLEVRSIYESRRYVLVGNDDLYLRPYVLWFFTIERFVSLRNADLMLSMGVNNVFNQHYMLVINRPESLRNLSLTAKIILK